MYMYVLVIATVFQSKQMSRSTQYQGTSINDVRQFSMIFDLPNYNVRQFLPYNVRFWGVILDLPTLKLDVINGRSPRYLTPCRQLSLSIRFSSNFTARLRIVFANTAAAPAQFSLFAQLSSSSIKLRKIKGLYGHARGQQQQQPSQVQGLGPQWR